MNATAGQTGASDLWADHLRAAASTQGNFAVQQDESDFDGIISDSLLFCAAAKVVIIGRGPLNIF